jgi:hypothetical protein
MSAVNLTIKALLAHFDTSPSVVSTRIYPMPVPPSTTLPAVAVALSGEDEGYTLAGASQYPLSVVQVHCIAGTARAANELGEAVKTFLRDHLYTGTDSPPSVYASFQKDGPDFTDYSDNLTTHRRVMSFTVRWR